MKRLRVGLAALAALGVASGVTLAVTHGTARGHAQSAPVLGPLPTDVQSKLNYFDITASEVMTPPAGVVSVESVEQTYTAGNGPATFDAAYLASMSSPVDGWTCLCWLLILTPQIPSTSEAGDAATWYAMAYNANDGTFFRGWDGNFEGCPQPGCPNTASPVRTPPPIVPPN